MFFFFTFFALPCSVAQVEFFTANLQPCFVHKPVLHVIDNHKQFPINLYHRAALQTACSAKLTSEESKNAVVHFALRTQLSMSLECNISGFFKSFG